MAIFLLPAGFALLRLFSLFGKPLFFGPLQVFEWVAIMVMEKRGQMLYVMTVRARMDHRQSDDSLNLTTKGGGES
jgi:hypothetical protein